MADALTFLQLSCLALLLGGALLYEVMKWKWRAEAAERTARNERLRRLAVEHELVHLRHLLSDLQLVPPHGEAPSRVNNISPSITVQSPEHTGATVTVKAAARAQLPTFPDQPV